MGDVKGALRVTDPTVEGGMGSIEELWSAPQRLNRRDVSEVSPSALAVCSRSEIQPQGCKCLGWRKTLFRILGRWILCVPNSDS